MKRIPKQIRHLARRGFTLVEMLISVTLVLLMMTLFSAIFQMATSSMKTQRGVAANDQKARAFTTALRADMAKRTFRYVQPYYPTESPSIGSTIFGDRAGYIYISTNDPFSDQDDLLQFTVSADQTFEDADDSPFLGRSELLYDWSADPDVNDTTRNTTLRFNPNQPEADDGDLFANKLSSSPAAEISYFVRGGNLIRRVMLLRNPLPIAGQDLATEPSTTDGNDYFGPLPMTNAPGFTYVDRPLQVNQNDPAEPTFFNLASGEDAPDDWQVTATNDFWRHFDFSAVPILAGGIPVDVAFVGINALDNSNTAPVAVTLGDPRYRFGFNRLTGLSREHDNPTEWQFLGRFTQAETSHRYFNWPLAPSRIENAPNGPDTEALIGTSGVAIGTAFANLNSGPALGQSDITAPGTPGNGNPMDIDGTEFQLNQSTGILRELSGSATGRGGERAVEDLLLANVQSMRVEIWDERLGRFVTPGHDISGIVPGATRRTQGDYNRLRQANLGYGPRGLLAPLGNRVFDTWTPGGADFNFSGGAPGEVLERQAPFTPYLYYPPQVSSTPPGPTPSSTLTDPAVEFDPISGRANANKSYWSALDAGMNRNTYAVGDIVFAVPSEFVARGVTGWDADADGFFSWDLDQSTFLLDGAGMRTISNPGFPPQGFQIAYRCIAAGSVGNAPPNWPRVPEQRFAESVPVGVTPAQWISIDNRRPLKTLKVIVQFFDQNTEKLRQLSLTLPLTTER